MGINCFFRIHLEEARYRNFAHSFSIDILISFLTSDCPCLINGNCFMFRCDDIKFPYQDCLLCFTLTRKEFSVQKRTENSAIIEIRLYRGFPRIRNHFFGYSLLFSNNGLLFYPLFFMKIEICFLYKGVSYWREPAVFAIWAF